MKSDREQAIIFALALVSVVLLSGISGWLLHAYVVAQR